MENQSQSGGDVKADEARVKITPEQLDAMMPKGKMVHTYMQGGPALLGADWKRADILKDAKEHGAELSGPQATAMKHGAIVWTKHRLTGQKLTAVFVETKATQP